MVILQLGPVTVTEGVEAETTWVPFPVLAPAMVKRCGKAAFFDLTETVQVPCMTSDMGFLLRNECCGHVRDAFG
jgi:hypothetical protein